MKHRRHSYKCFSSELLSGFGPPNLDAPKSGSADSPFGRFELISLQTIENFIYNFSTK